MQLRVGRATCRRLRISVGVLLVVLVVLVRVGLSFLGGRSRPPARGFPPPGQTNKLVRGLAVLQPSSPADALVSNSSFGASLLCMGVVAIGVVCSAGRSLDARRRPARFSTALLGTAVSTMPASVSSAEEPERRLNTWDGRVYTLAELQKTATYWTDAQIKEHWEHNCKPIDGSGPQVAEAVPPQVEAWRKVWTFGSLQRMWSTADMGHVHAISGLLYIILGGGLLLDVASHDFLTANGVAAARHISVEFCSALLVVGAVNAVSGLQPALLAPKFTDVQQVLGFGTNGNLKSAGFLDASIFYFILVYQAFRVLPAFPAALTPLDPFIGGLTVLTALHARFVLNAWVEKGSLERFSVFGADPIFAPPLLNLPVTLHLLLQGQAWVDQMSSAYPGWPEAFFYGNFALAWAASMVTFALSLYERRVISVEVRGLLTVIVPLLTFAAIQLHTSVLMPDAGWTVMLTLSPPQN